MEESLFKKYGPLKISIAYFIFIFLLSFGLGIVKNAPDFITPVLVVGFPAYAYWIFLIVKKISQDIKIKKEGVEKTSYSIGFLQYLGLWAAFIIFSGAFQYSTFYDVMYSKSVILIPLKTLFNIHQLMALLFVLTIPAIFLMYPLILFIQKLLKKQQKILFIFLESAVCVHIFIPLFITVTCSFTKCVWP